jgi:hypothetical protein
MITVYDNMNFKDRKRDGMRAMTTAALVLCPELSPSGLCQSMHNQTIPLILDNIFNSPAISGMDGGIGLEITGSLIRMHTCGGVFTQTTYRLYQK